MTSSSDRTVPIQCSLSMMDDPERQLRRIVPPEAETVEDVLYRMFDPRGDKYNPPMSEGSVNLVREFLSLLEAALNGDLITLLYVNKGEELRLVMPKTGLSSLLPSPLYECIYGCISPKLYSLELELVAIPTRG